MRTGEKKKPGRRRHDSVRKAPRRIKNGNFDISDNDIEEEENLNGTYWQLKQKIEKRKNRRG